MYKVLNKQHGNAELMWHKGLWLGRCTTNNDVLIGTEQGTVIRTRTIKRLPTEQQHDKELFNKLKGTPWQPLGTMLSTLTSFWITEHCFNSLKLQGVQRLVTRLGPRLVTRLQQLQRVQLKGCDWIN
jgi:hypothetical protein